MPGSHSGGLKTARKNRLNDPDFYQKLGRKGAEAYRERQKLGIAKPRGFAAMTEERRKEAGRKGGKMSRRVRPERSSWFERMRSKLWK